MIQLPQLIRPFKKLRGDIVPQALNILNIQYVRIYNIVIASITIKEFTLFKDRIYPI